MLYVPEAVNTCTRDGIEEVLAVPLAGSLKFHDHEAIVPLETCDESVNAIDLVLHAGVLNLK